MRYKELKIVDIPKWGTYLRGQWREHFAGHLSEEEQEAIAIDHFLWHLCASDTVECLEKEKAVAAFKKQLKRQCMIFYQFIDEAYLLDDARTLTIDDLPYTREHMYYGDLYVVDSAFEWTFIMTHERECGPYFLQNV